MTEKEKRNRGELYNPILDHELQSEMLRAKELCHEYNMLPPSDGERKSELVRKIIGRMGEDCSIISPFWCDYGYNIETGDHFTANHNCVILDGAKVTFGNYVYVGPDCGFYTAGHPLDVRRRNALFRLSGVRKKLLIFNILDLHIRNTKHLTEICLTEPGEYVAFI